ncbi:carbohydrate ABC transporter permease, partial [Lachnoclostridium sp.]
MKNKNKTKRTILIVLLTLLSLFMLVPFYWMVISSLKLNKDVFSIPMKWWPDKFQWENYVLIWKKLPLVTFFFNTAKLTIITTIIQLLTSCLAAYGFTKMKFKGRDIIFLMYVTTISVPWQVYMIPQFILVSKMGLNDSHLGLILMQAFSAFGVFLIRQFYISIPDELCEAARIDGLNEFGIFRKIVFPLGKPAMATLAIFTFTNVWNDFMGPLIYLKTKELKTIQLGIRMFISQYGADYAWI